VETLLRFRENIESIMAQRKLQKKKMSQNFAIRVYKEFPQKYFA